MERALLAAAVVAVAALVAVLVERSRQPDAPTQGRGDRQWAVPSQLDRADFEGPSSDWLVAVFTSATCESCQQAVVKAQALRSAEVAVQEVEVKARKDLHDRYGVEAVPTVVVADAEGVVRASIVGPPSASELWAVVAGLRDNPPDADRTTPADPGGDPS